MSEIALLGSKSSHGGVVITASGFFTCDGVKVVVDGDQHRCPIDGHGITPVSATSKVRVDGIPIVRVGDHAGCGAIITTGYAASDID